jgi:hypothetical protein
VRCLPLAWIAYFFKWVEAAGIPATVFLTTGQIGRGKEFWWDELARIVLCRVEPLSTSLTVADERLQIDLPPIDPEMEPRATWRAWDEPMTVREATYQMLWRGPAALAAGAP